MTSGLTIGAWSRRNAVADEADWLALALRWDELPWTIGNLIHSLSLPESRQEISYWASDNLPAARIVDQFSRALARDPSLLQSFPAANLVSAGPHFKGKLAEGFLSAAVCIAYPTEVTPETSWRLILVLWLLVHGVNRATIGNYADRNLREIARALYSFQNTVSNHCALLQQVAHGLYPLTTFATVNLSLQARADTHKKGASPAEKRLLQALISVSQFDNAPDRTSGSVPALRVPKLALPKPSPLSIQEIEELERDSPEIADREVAQARPSLLQGEDDESDLLEFDAPLGATEAELQFLGKSVLLLSAEQRQLLPWTWTTPNPMEVRELEAWINQHLESDDNQLATLAILLMVAHRCGRSLLHALGVPVRESVDEGWSLSLKTGTLRRLPPIRQNSWTPKNGEQRVWVRALSTYQVIELPENALALLRASLTGSRDATLERLWRAVSKEDCESFFLKVFSATLPRLRPFMLSSLLRQREFTRTADEAMARLLASAPRSGLPASCAYGNWLSSDLSAAIRTHGKSAEIESIALGSRLDPIESLLVQSIASATAKLDSIRASGDSIGFHNAYVAMLVVQLLAATGARPVLDLAESAAHFNVARGFVYLDDKASGELRQGRLVPLPTELTNSIFGEYRRHLGMVAELLRDAHPDLSAQIACLAQGEQSRLPLFFFIELHQNGPHWQSVSQAFIEDLALFEWPLPLNLFRHRLAQQMRRLGLNPEIIDGLMGHAETHAATYGDHSFRVWKDDMEVAKPLLQQSYEALGFSAMSSWTAQPIPLPSTGQAHEPIARSYGIQKRSEARRAGRIAAFKSAELTIRTFLGNRSLTDLEPDEVDKLSRLLLFHENGLPSHSGNLRYEFLLLRIRHAENKRRQRVKLRRRFQRVSSENSPFLPLAAKADEVAAALGSRLGSFSSPSFNGNGRGKSKFHDRLSAVIEFALHHRIANVRMLKDVFKGPNVRFVCSGELLDLEYGQFDDGLEDPHVPVQRFSVPVSLAIRLGGSSQEFLKDEVLANPLPPSMQPLANVFRDHAQTLLPTIAGLIETCARVIDQSNVMNRPGVAAGTLAGRVATFSPTWPDHVLLRTGTRRSFTEGASDAATVATQLSAPPKLTRDKSDQATPPEDQRESTANFRQQSAKDFARDIRKVLNGQLPAAAKGGDDSGASEKNLTRKQMAPTIARVIQYYRGKASTSVLILGEWVRYLVNCKNGKHEISTCERYFNALAPIFRSVAYDADLLSLDADGITDLYVKVMGSCDVKHKDYIGNRLVAFHRWAEASDFALPRPDWSELPEFAQREGVSPGLIAEREYLEVFNMIWHANEPSDELRRAAAFLLIGGYRFGLREEEAWGLLRGDWVDCDGLTVVLVTHNHLRGLKGRTRSRRQVPLLIRLTAMEDQVIAHCQANSTAIFGDQINVGFLEGVGRVMPEIAKAVALVNQALKQVTGNRRLSHHHLRHSYANRILSGVLQFSPEWRRSLGWEHDDGKWLSQQLLGQVNCTRRLGWGIARLLGHRGPTTTFRSYIHFLLEWATVEEPAPSCVDVSGLSWISNLDRLPVHSVQHTVVGNSLPVAPTKLDFQVTLKLLRLLSRGWSSQRAATALGVDARLASEIASTVWDIGMRLKSKVIGNDHQSSASGFAFLKGVKEDGWKRLMTIRPRSIAPALQGCVAQFVEMVGATKQILMWTPGHVAIVAGVLSYACIDAAHYEIAASAEASDDLIEAARNVGLRPQRLKTLLEQKKIESQRKRAERDSRGSPYEANKRAVKKARNEPRFNAVQLDVARTGESGVYTVPGRLALLPLEVAGETPRNSIEFLVVAIAAVTQSLSIGNEIPDN